MRITVLLTLFSLGLLILSSFIPVMGDTITGNFNPFVGDTALVIENTSVYVDSVITVNVTCYPSQNVKSWEFSIEYNASLLQAENVTEGSLFGDFSSSFNDGTINNTAGNITSMYCLIVGDGNTSTTGTTIQVNFTGITSGISEVDFVYDGVHIAPGVTNYSAYIPISVSNGTVTVIETGSPTQSNPYPSDDATGVETTPQLNITCNDGNGETMSINWSSNSSGSWVLFGYNQSTNGTFYQDNSNFSSQGTKYYWSVNATDGVYWSNETYSFTTLTTGSVTMSSPYPENESLTNYNDSTINITVSNPLGETMNVYFYWFNNGTLIGSDLSVSNNTVANVTVPFTYTFYQQYYWNVTVTSTSYNNQSGNWTIQAESEHPDVSRNGAIGPEDLSGVAAHYMESGDYGRWIRADVSWNGAIGPEDLSGVAAHYMESY